MIADEQEGHRVGRPRSAEAHQAILDATLSLLAKQGFDGMSIEEVASRAGVGKATIYRWWNSKEELALEALQHLYSRQPVIDTGDFRHDLIAMIEDFIQFVEERKPQLEGLTYKLIGEFKTHPKLFQMFYARIIEPRVQRILQMIEQAQQRGVLRSDLDPLVLFGLCGSPYIYHMLLSGKIVPQGDHWAEQVVDAILYGVAVRREGSNCEDAHNTSQIQRGGSNASEAFDTLE